MKIKNFAIATLLLSGAILSGCSNQANEKNTNKNQLAIYTTIFPLKDFASKIGGKYVNVTSIYPNGVDAHDYEPTSKQVVNIANADLFIYNGAEMEPFAEKLDQTLKNSKVNILEASKGIHLIKFVGEEDHEDNGNHSEEHHHDKDPHVWLDPTLAKIEAENIKNELIKLKPNQKEYFEANFSNLEKQFNQLDQEFQSLMNHAKRKDIVVSHSAYGYWEHHYGIKQVPITGLSPSVEPSQKELKNVVDFVKKNNVKYILFETFATPKVATVVKDETNAEILRLNHLATISDEDEKAGKDYFELMNENIEVLKKVLNNK